MTDSIVMEIERSRDPGQRSAARRPLPVPWPACTLRIFVLTASAALREAQAILRRLRCRDLYKIVGDRLLSPEQAVHASKVATPGQIASCADASLPLSPDDIIVHQLKINYAMKDKNPVDSVSFYNGNDGPFHLPKSKVSLMIPDVFEEKYEFQHLRSITTRFFILRSLTFSLQVLAAVRQTRVASGGGSKSVGQFLDSRALCRCLGRVLTVAVAKSVPRALDQGPPAHGAASLKLAPGALSGEGRGHEKEAQGGPRLKGRRQETD
jgi:hypothetical protein